MGGAGKQTTLVHESEGKKEENDNRKESKGKRAKGEGGMERACGKDVGTL